MGRKSSRQDKNEGMLDKAKGKAKEAAGAVSGDEAKKGEEHSSPNGQVSEKKAASPGPSEASSPNGQVSEKKAASPGPSEA